MDYETKKELTKLINQQIMEIFKMMFGVEISPIKTNQNNFNHDDLVTKIRLHQDDKEIILRFGFPRDVITPLLKKVYGPIMAMHESTLEDAVSEVSNIACSGLKTYLNERGENFSMDLPEIDCTFSCFKEKKPETLYMNFMLQNSGFTLNLNVDEIRKEKGTI